MVVILLTLGIVAIIVIVFALIFVPIPTREYYPARDNELDPTMNKLLQIFGGDILAVMPKSQGIFARNKINKIQDMLRAAGNPWNISPQEFLLLRNVLLIVGGFVGILLAILLKTTIDIPILTIFSVVAFPLIGLAYPGMVYSNLAKSRKAEFVRDFPEAVDFLTMALQGGGYTLGRAFTEITKYLKPGVVRDEIMIITADLRTGMTMEAALNGFANRAPTEAVRSFAHALNNANRLSTPMGDILKAQSREMRRDLENSIETKITKLPTKVMMALAPTAGFALMAIAMAPTMIVLVEQLGGM